MHRSTLLTSCALLSVLAAGCGSLASDTDNYEPLAVLQGELTNPDAIATQSAVRVAVVWNCGDFDGDMYRVTQEVEVQPVFPSKFQLELREPPPSECMIDPFADTGQNDPPQGGVEAPTEPPPAPAPGSTPQNVPGASASNLKLALGTIAAYDDLNHNGKLDLVSPGAPDYIDGIVGANESLLLVYVEGNAGGWGELVDSDGNLPSQGYNLLSFSEPISVGPDSGDVAVMCGGGQAGGGTGGAGDGTGDGTDEPVPMPEGPAEDDYEPPTMGWMDASTFFVLTMTSDPQFASMMCTDGGGVSASGSSGGAAPEVGDPVEVPPVYPSPDDPNLSCAPDGLSYFHEVCVDQGVCRGKHCTAQCWYVPDAANPPADWPCPIE